MAQRLYLMLAPVQKAGSLALWCDQDIKPGENWKEEIEKANSRAKIALLLVSGAFLASDFIQNSELPIILQSHTKTGLRIYWVLLEPCLIEQTPLYHLQAAHPIKSSLTEITDVGERKRTITNICQINTQIVTAFDLWFPKYRRQRVLWPSTVQLSSDYFQSLQRHAVPLDERAVAALSHSAMGLDIYAWLAQRLHRVPPHKPVFIPWSAVKTQFGRDYRRMVDFKRKFRKTLTLVCTQYRGARIELYDAGATLRNSPPPVKGRMAPLPNA